MPQSKVILTCANPACNKEFSKSRSEYNRSEKLGRAHFCCLKCFAQAKGLCNFKDKINKNTDHLKKGSERDDFSPFRQQIRAVIKSSKERNKEYSVANFAKNAFAEQELIEFCDEVARFRKLIDENSHSFERFSKDDFRYLTKSDIDFSNNFNLLIGRDEYSPFRQHLRLARRRVRASGRECNITLEYLKELWENQSGRCPYTGWKLDNPSTTNEYNGYDLHPKRASLDRIDSARGYVPGNVQFVSVIANYGKRDFREE